MTPVELEKLIAKARDEQWTELELCSKELTSLPKSIEQLTNLHELRLGNNNLTSLPEWIGQLTSLTKLDLSGNQLINLPESVG